MVENKANERKVMSIVSNDGSIEEVEVILAFEFKDTGKEYVVYTKNERDCPSVKRKRYHTGIREN